MGRLFGTNGIRGIFAEDFTLELVHDVTASFSAYVGRGPILVGYDGRDSSPLVAGTVCATLNACGLDCSNAGLVPTPCLQFATKRLGYAGGVMVTASHNPPEYNGIKPCAADGVEISREDEGAVEDIYFGGRRGGYGGPFGATSGEPGAIPSYIEGVLSQISPERIGSGGLTVVLDLGNGAQAVAAPEFCRRLGCDTFTVNGEIDGAFPGRGSEPTPHNLRDLSEAVRRHGADLGVAFDGDGDRSIFCDGRGDVLTGDRSALLLARHILRGSPNSKLVTCLNSGTAIEDIAGEHGAEVIRTRTGSVEVSRAMVGAGAVLGFEENGGFMYGRHSQARDGLMTTGLMLDLLASSGRGLADLAGEMPPSFTAKDKVGCTAGQAGRLISALKAEFPDADTTDGIKISSGPKEWVMVRPSGTEPIVRVYAEAGSQEALDRLIGGHMDRIRSLIAG